MYVLINKNLLGASEQRGKGTLAAANLPAAADPRTAGLSFHFTFFFPPLLSHNSLHTRAHTQHTYAHKPPRTLAELRKHNNIFFWQKQKEIRTTRVSL